MYQDELFNTAHNAVIEDSPPTCHFTSFVRGLRSQRNSGETQQLDHTQGLSLSSEVNDREKGKWDWQSPLSKLLTLPSADKKNSCTAQRLHTNDALSLILYTPITAWVFSIPAPLPALSILTIFLDKCQMKSFEHINILNKVKLFCLKKKCFSPLVPNSLGD